jgi:hypothetical protein
MSGHPTCTTAHVTPDDRALIHSFKASVSDETGRSWRATAYGRLGDSLWLGWIVFTNEAGETVETDVETRQPDRVALEYWAAGVEPIYLDGALARARGVPVSSRPPRAAPRARSNPSPRSPARRGARGS